VEKFAEILAVEVGNHALKTLPFGGVFLIGGVTYGISKLIHEPNFIELFAAKGRLTDTMTKIPVFLVKEEVELGLLGAEEKAFRNLKIY
jgi:glucokinase